METFRRRLGFNCESAKSPTVHLSLTGGLLLNHWPGMCGRGWRAGGEVVSRLVRGCLGRAGPGGGSAGQGGQGLGGEVAGGDGLEEVVDGAGELPFGGWAAPNFPDSGIEAISCCTLPAQVLVVDFLRSPVPECRMETCLIVPELDVPRNVFARFPDRGIRGTVDPLDLHHGIE